MTSRTATVKLAVFVAAFAIMSWDQALGGTTIPTIFEAGHIYATPRLANGRTLRLLVDTGGGGPWTYILWSTPSLKLAKAEPCRVDGAPVELFRPPAFSGVGLPPPNGPCRGIMVIPKPAGQGQNIDGIVGAGYLATHGVWTFDYPKQRLVREDRKWKPAMSARAVPLGFATVAPAERLGFPRLTINVDGEALDLLLDTGATGHPTAETLAAAGEPVVDGVGVTSYITTSAMDRWHARHPDWTVIEKGDDLFGPSLVARVIRVPQIEWGSMKIGPVWFTERADANFNPGMADDMDKPPEGALGGNVFRHMYLTIDYGHDAAWIVCQDTSFCGPSGQ